MAELRKRKPGRDVNVDVSVRKPLNGDSDEKKVLKQPITSKTGEKASTTPIGMQSISSFGERISKQPLWIILAIASGACAAINGVFAKLTTTALTSTLASSISYLLGLKVDNTYVDVALRSTFFTLNVVFNIIMWTLFTAALTRATSTTRVSIVNVSSNFFVTAVLGALIFGEKLPLGWWLGAALLASGNIVIGRRAEEEKVENKEQEQEQHQPSGRLSDDEETARHEEDEPLIELGR